MPGTRKVPAAIFYLLFLLSGACGLVYQTLWLRQFALVLGNSLRSATVVIACFMGGLALGALLAGRLSRRGGRGLLRTYALLEAGAALAALAVSLALPALEALVPALIGAEAPPLLSLLARLLLSCLLLLPPTILIGTTLPVLVRFLTDSLELAGRKVGALYGWNTLGAFLGSTLTGFWLIRLAGLRLSLLGAAGANLLVALAALALWLALPRGTEDRARVMEPEALPAEPLTPRRKLLLASSAITGMAGLACEVAWARFLSYILYNDIYAYYLMLAVVLLGIGLGSLAYARWLDCRRISLRLLGGLQLTLALAVGAGYLLVSLHYRGEGSGLWMKRVQELLAGLPEGEFQAMLAIKLVYALAAMLVPTLLLGMIFPLTCRLYFDSREQVGRHTGLLYAANTGGGILGIAACGFLLIPALGVQPALFLVAGLNLGLGIVLLTAAEGRSGWRKPRALLLPATALAAFLVMALVPGNQVRRFTLKNKGHLQLIYYREGLTGTVSVLKDRVNGIKNLYINAIPEVHNSFAGMLTFKLMGHLPLLLHPGQPRQVLMVTYGAGIASGAVAVHPIERLDIVELERAVVEGSRYFTSENRGVIDDPRVHLQLDDGRNYLAGTSRRYDAIISDATNPGSSDSWLLYTLEFYRLCRARLAPGGMMVQWLPWHTGNRDSYRTIIRTFQEVFPHTSLWFAKDYTLLLGMDRPLRIDYPELARRLGDPALQADLAPWCLGSPLELVDCFLMGDQAVRRMVAGSRVSTDDLPFYQLTATREEEPREILSLLLEHRERVDPYLAALEPDRTAALADSLETAFRAQGEVIRRDYAAALRADPGSCKVANFWRVYREEVEYLERVADLNPDNYHLQLHSAVSLATHREFGRARRFFQRLVQLDPEDPSGYVSLANLDYQLGAYEGAEWAYRQALERGRREPELLRRLGRCLLVRGETVPAISFLEEAQAREPDQREGLLDLGVALGQAGRSEEAVERFNRLLELFPDHPEARINLGWLLVKQGGMDDRAGEQFARAVELVPRNYSAWTGLGIVLQRQGRLEQARMALTKALELWPENELAAEQLHQVEQALAGR